MKHIKHIKDFLITEYDGIEFHYITDSYFNTLKRKYKNSYHVAGLEKHVKAYYYVNVVDDIDDKQVYTEIRMTRSNIKHKESKTVTIYIYTRSGPSITEDDILWDTEIDLYKFFPTPSCLFDLIKDKNKIFFNKKEIGFGTNKDKKIQNYIEDRFSDKDWFDYWGSRLVEDPWLFDILKTIEVKSAYKQLSKKYSVEYNAFKLGII